LIQDLHFLLRTKIASCTTGIHLDNAVAGQSGRLVPEGPGSKKCANPPLYNLWRAPKGYFKPAAKNKDADNGGYQHFWPLYAAAIRLVI
jgi:hypothetical protein